MDTDEGYVEVVVEGRHLGRRVVTLYHLNPGDASGDINLAQVARGKAYYDNCGRFEYAEAERRAKNTPLGLWKYE